MGHRIVCAEFVNWAKQEARRIERGEAQKYHALLADLPYGLEFMGKEWDKFDNRQPEDETFTKSGAGPFNRAKVRHSAAPGYGRSFTEAKVGFQQQAKMWGEAMLPLLRPGALVFMFGGTRMWHRLACGMEDAGFHMFDTCLWVYGSGFPKAQDISKLVKKRVEQELQKQGVTGPIEWK